MKLPDKRVWLPIVLIFAIMLLGTGGVLLARQQKLEALAQEQYSQTSNPIETVAPTQQPQQITSNDPKATTDTKPNKTEEPKEGQKVPAENGNSAPKKTTQTPEQSSGEAPPTATQEPEKKVAQVTLSIRVPDENRYILSPVKFDLQDGDTVLSVLQRITRAKGIQMEYSGSKKTAYVEGIDNLYEFSKGPGSGWMYTVNGEVVGRSCGGTSIKENDVINWIYTLDLGKDIGGASSLQ